MVLIYGSFQPWTNLLIKIIRNKAEKRRSTTDIMNEMFISANVTFLWDSLPGA
jgi:hypothetical protein